ncbi:hypothetical protein [Salinisphaera sp. T31B1]|uniref:serine O-acetyltransferase n=1 Tax=Salinisphaera sp. T31B1 TaxID=727963 RepID=UPI003340BA58
MSTLLGAFKRHALGGVSARLDVYLFLIRYFRRKNKLNFARFFSKRLEIKYGLFVSERAEIARTVKFPHPTGIVIGDGVVIEDNVVVYQNVTIGGARIGDWQKNNYPKIRRNTVIFAGAAVLGNVEVGRDCVVGTLSVVLKSVPAYSTAVGIPARVIESTTGTR